MQITHVNNGKTFLLVEVPEGLAANTIFYVVPPENYGFEHDGYLLVWRASFGDFMRGFKIEHRFLPSGKYTIIGTADALTEEQAREITPLVYDGTDDELIQDKIYECFDGSDFVCSTGLESLSSLLRSHNLQPETTLILQSTPPAQ